MRSLDAIKVLAFPGTEVRATDRLTANSVAPNATDPRLEMTRRRGDGPSHISSKRSAANKCIMSAGCLRTGNSPKWSVYSLLSPTRARALLRFFRRDSGGSCWSTLGLSGSLPITARGRTLLTPTSLRQGSPTRDSRERYCVGLICGRPSSSMPI